MANIFDDLNAQGAAPDQGAAPSPRRGRNIFEDLDGAPAEERGGFMDRLGTMFETGFEGTLAGQAAVNLQDKGAYDRALVDLVRPVLDVMEREGLSQVPLTFRDPGSGVPIGTGEFADMSIEDFREALSQRQALGEQESAEFQERRAQTLAEREALPSFTEEDTLLGKAGAGATNLAGLLAGSALSPESLLSFGRGATLLSRAGRGALGGASGAAVAEPVVQQQEIRRGEREEAGLGEGALNVALGGLLGAGLNVTPDAVRGIRNLIANRLNKPEVEVTAEDLEQFDPEELIAEVERLNEQSRQAPEEVEPGIAERTGTDRPGPVGEGQPPVERRRARREVERDMGQAFDQTDVLRREDVDVTEEGVTTREGATPLRDPTGEQASPTTYGARLAARRVAEDLGVTLSDQDLRLAARDIAADPEADMRQIVRDYSQEGREQAVRVAEARRRRRDENLRQDDLSAEFTPERDFRAGAGREEDLTPRMQQELEERARRVPEGVNVEQPGLPRDSVDRISSRQPGGLRGQYQRGPRPGPEPEQPRPPGQTFEGEVAGQPAAARGAAAEQGLPPTQRRLPAAEQEAPARTEEEAFLDQYAEGPDLEVETATTPEAQANREATRQTVQRLRERDLITPQHAFRGVSRAELGAIAETGRLQVGQDMEGQPGISAAVIGDGQFPMYGDGAGIIAPPDQVTDSGRASEVLIDENTDPRQLRYVVDGRVRTFDELQDFAEGGPTATPEGGPTAALEGSRATAREDETQATEETDDGLRQERQEAQDTETEGRVQVEPEEGVTSQEPGPAGGQLYGGIPLDRITAAVRKVIKGEQTAARELSERLGTLIEDAKTASGGVRGRGRATQRSMATDLWRVTLGSLDGDMRVMANGFNSDTLKSLPDMFHATAGRGAGVEQTFDEAVQSRNSRLRDIDQTLAYMRENNVSGKPQQEQIIRLVENPKTPRRGAVGEAANRIERFLQGELGYMREAGVELGEVRDGYFPRQMDTGKASGDPEGFIKAATRAYKKMGLNDQDAREAAKAYWESTVYGVSGKPGEPPRSSQIPNFMKSRVFTKEAAAEMSAFRVQDIDAVLGQYTMRATRRAEVARRFGDNWSGWADLENRILEEDSNVQAVLPAIRDRVALSAGINQHSLSHTAQGTLSALRTWTTLATLPKAAMASLGELVLAPVRGTTGNIPGDLAQSVTNFWTHMANFSATMTGLGRSEKMTAAFEMAEDIGLIAGVGHNALMAARFAGGDPVGRVQSEVLASFFRRNLLENLTNYTRVTSMLQGQVFMRRLANQMNKNSKRASFFLRELGVKQGQEADFAEFVRGFGDRMPMGQELSGEFAATYRNALQRFTDQTVMRPSASTRPKWASHPLGAMIFQLQAFGYAFQKNVVNRQVRATKELGWVDGAAFSAASITGLAGLVAVQGLVRYWRDELYDPDINDRKTSGAFAEGALSQAGLFGVADPYLQSLTGIKYQKPIWSAFTGPFLGGMGDALDDVAAATLMNSENTQTAERNLAESMYDWLVEPMAQAAMTAAPAGPITGKLASAATVYGVPSGREPFATALTGPDRPAREQPPIQGTLEWIFGGEVEDVTSAGGRGGGRPAGRSAGRGAGREATR